MRASWYSGSGRKERMKSMVIISPSFRRNSTAHLAMYNAALDRKLSAGASLMGKVRSMAFWNSRLALANTPCS